MAPQDKGNAITAISLITAACLIGDSMLYVVLPLHYREAGLESLWQVGAILSCNRFIRLPLNPFVAWLYGRISVRAGIVGAVGLAILTTAAYGFAQGLIAWLLLRCFWGAAWTFLRLGAYFTILHLSAADNRGKLMGQYNGLYRLGSLFGMLLGGFAADWYGLQITALGFAVLTGCGALACFAHVPPAALVQERQAKEVTPQAVSVVDHCDGRVLWALNAGLCIAMIYQGMFTATLSYLVETHAGTLVEFGFWTVGAASLAGVLQAIRWAWEPWLAPWLGKKSDGANGRYPLLVSSLIAGSVCFALLPSALPLPLWLCLLLLVQITATSLTTLADALAADAAASASGASAMTLYSLSIDLGAAAGPLLSYLANQYMNSYAACYSAAILLAMLALQSLRHWRTT